MNINKRVAYAIRATRIEQGLSGEYVGIMLGITKGAYSNLENGKTHITLEKLESLAKIFNTTLEALLKLEPKQKHPESQSFSMHVGSMQYVYKIV